MEVMKCRGFSAAPNATEMPGVERGEKSRASDEPGPYKVKHLLQRTQMWFVVLGQSLTI